MAYQVPKSTHPWRRYRDRLEELSPMDEAKMERDRRQNFKPLHEFLSEIVVSWESIEVYTSAYGKESKFKIKSLPQHKQAAWLAGILRRNYA